MLNEKGHEVLDSTPIARTVGFERPPSMQELIQRYVRTELSRQAAQAGAETFEEADDFDVDDDIELKSRYEVDESLPRWKEDDARRQAVEAAEARFLRKQQARSEPGSGAGGERSELEAAPEARPVGKAPGSTLST